MRTIDTLLEYNFTNEEYMRIMEIPFKQVLDSYFPNI